MLIKENPVPQKKNLSATSSGFPVQDLLAWYSLNARALPWRKEKPEPYEVWISEVMSQQTVMAALIPYFQRWMRRFPTLETLAKANASDVLAQWEGLGYYSRARNLHKSAQLLWSYWREHRQWPRTYESWLALPGIGPYTAAAITSIAFSEPVIGVDGNVIRVLSRYFGILNPLNNGHDQQLVRARAKQISDLISQGSHGTFFQALMELGSQLCKPKGAVDCSLCPLEKNCYARKKSQLAQIPRPKQRKKTTKVLSLALIYRNSRGAILLRQIPEGLRLHSQWELPQWEFVGEDASQGAQQLRKKINQHFPVFGPVSHSITHHQYVVHGVEAGPWKGPLPKNHAWWQWANESFDGGVLTSLTRKLMKELKK